MLLPTIATQTQNPGARCVWRQYRGAGKAVRVLNALDGFGEYPALYAIGKTHQIPAGFPPVDGK